LVFPWGIFNRCMLEWDLRTLYDRVRRNSFLHKMNGMTLRFSESRTNRRLSWFWNWFHKYFSNLQFVDLTHR
jgi:hypothetical protein